MPKQLRYELNNSKKIYTTTELRALGYTRYAVERMSEIGMLEKITGSVYENALFEGEESDFYYVMPLVPGGIICMLSAAVYYNLSTYWAHDIDVAVKKGKRIVTMPAYPSMNIYHFGKDRYEIGIDTVNIDGNEYKIYDIEKTVIDIIYFRNQIGIQETKEILTKYLHRMDCNINKLHRYAQKLQCEKTLRTYLEVLI
ncbi:MAG: hypothetical protein MJ133_11680 [Lachnospiraceae bacterium]|nr:hypothetical protein [Lachnospiraceae bacterium]